MAGRLAGQTINDRLLAAKHSIAGQGLAKSVCKATTEEMIGPKKKHLDYLVQCTNEPNVSIPQLANLLIERSQNTNWVVVYKALITVHHMMCYGNERFTQYLASSNSSFQLSTFLDKSGVQGMLSARTGYDMSPFIRRYARYLNEKAMSYRTVAFDFCKKRGNNEDGMLRTMHTDKLLKTLPVLQNQLDALLEFDCSANDLTNGVINNCFMLLFRDLIRLFACYNNGIINLLEKFFDMNKKQCREALDIYKKFLVRMDKVGEFLKVAENIGIDKGDIPDLTKAPSSLLEALEQHLATIEGKKSSTSSTPSQTATNQKNVRSAVSALSSTSSSFGTVVANGRIDSHANGIDETLKIQALAEEEAAMNQFKNKVQSPVNTANNPFFASNGNHSAAASSVMMTQSVDLFAAESLSTSQIRPSDDLLQLNNPFADVFSQPGQNVPAPAPAPINAFQLPGIQQPNNVNAWIANGNGYSTPHQMPMTNVQNGTFVSESSFQSVFGNNEIKSSGFDALGGLLQPMSSGQGGGNHNNNNNNHLHHHNHHHQNSSGNNQQPGSALLTGDLESSLASLAENLSINSRPPPVKEIQWNSPKNGSKVNNSWTPQPMSATTGAGYKPMNQSMTTTTAQPPLIVQQQMFPNVMQPVMGMRPLAANAMLPTQRPNHASAVPPAANQMGPQQSLLFH